MKIYDIRLLKTTTGKKHIKFFYKTLLKGKVRETTKIFAQNVKLLENKKIDDTKIKEYISEKKFIKIMKMAKISDNKMGGYSMKLYKNNEIWFYKIENTSDVDINFKDCDILLDRNFFINDRYIKYVIIKNNTGV
ncbi:hypothetical protein JMUB3935_1311 [Leptotrichia trevisanii]|uniref:Uncharacterized protein n=1 Tax=Leptotrichia trevisanii TaxID=109328 RepID=A0A510K0M8_9FUSO|nr:hypothetical protein [Leptotrichia trevisanii]BBM45199.1 hypothetical protein JMUB3870_1317 [Leptotrichia trevisanii]BBM52333.1 hypothetical protein JMUB3935_1311 [Leptotrichia trevisanii]